MKDYKGIKNFDELVEREHGKIGTESRNKYEGSAQLFILSEMKRRDKQEANSSKADLKEELSLTEFTQIINKSEDDAANGNVKGVQELDEDIDTWT